MLAAVLATSLLLGTTVAKAQDDGAVTEEEAQTSRRQKRYIYLYPW